MTRLIPLAIAAAGIGIAVLGGSPALVLMGVVVVIAGVAMAGVE